MSKIKLELSHAMDYLGSIGNIGYLWDFIDYFEKKLADEIAPYIEEFMILKTPNYFYKNYANYAYLKCPNFAAWLRFYVELICNKSLASISRAEDCQKKITEYRFMRAVKAIVAIGKKESIEKKISDAEFEYMARSLKMVVELRHTIQHGGMPNILRKLYFKDVTIEDIAEMMVPQQYEKTREVFQRANKLLELLPKAIIVMYQNGAAELKKQDPK